MGETGHSDRAFVLGLDGVPWSLVSRWAATGELPNLARLMAEGAAGPLESTVPPTTPLAWPSIATGVTADKHGIYGFQKLTPSHGREMYTSADRRQPALWNVLSPALVGNVPMTYPAEPIDGKLFTGMMTPELDEGFTSSPALREALLDRVPDYEVGLDWSEYVGREDALLADITELVEMRRTAMRLLMETTDWRLFFVVFTAPDRLQHLIWEEDVLLDHYRQLDDVVGEAMAYADRFDATLYVVSDHGFGPISTFVAVNSVLERSGLLVREAEDGARGVLSRLGVTRDGLAGALSRIGITEELLLDVLPTRLVESVAEQVPGDHALFDVDHARTEAFVHDVGCLYVNDVERFDAGCVEPGEREAVKEAAAGHLRDVSDPDTGETLLSVHDGAELFPADDDSPDLIVTTANGYEQTKSLEGELLTNTGGKTASHRPEGVLFARGPRVEAGTRVEGASVVDVAPTLLHDLGEPVPANADGHVLSELFATGSTPAETDPVTAAYEDGGAGSAGDADFESVADRLAGLGYLE
jgi:predicted AlkP superfamily phosphohydrolase/phosphomutase